MEREELLSHLRVLAARARTSNDHQVKHASVVLSALTAALLTDTTPLLSHQAAEFSSLMIAAGTNLG